MTRSESDIACSVTSIIEEKMTELLKNVATKDGLNELKKLIMLQNDKIEKLESHVAILHRS